MEMVTMQIRMLSAALALTLVFVAGTAFAQTKPGDKAPEFKATGVDGKEYVLPKDAKATVVCFTCNQCPVSVAYEDRFIEFTKKYKEKGVQFIAINVNYTEDLTAMKERSEEKGFNFPYAFDATGDSARAYGATRTPHLFVVDSNGKIAYVGAFDDSMTKPVKGYVANAVDAVLKGEAPKEASTNAVGCGIKLPRKAS
jgi:peroxiredoxin